MNNLLCIFITIVVSIAFCGCGGSGSSSSTVDGTSGGSAWYSADGIAGSGGSLQINSQTDVVLAGQATPPYTTPSYPTPTTTGYIVFDDDKTLSALLADPLANATLVGSTVQVATNLIIDTDTTLYIDQPGWSLQVMGDLVVNGYMASRTATGEKTAITVIVNGKSWVSGYIDNSSNGNGIAGQPVSFTGTELYLRGTVSAAGADSTTGTGGQGATVTLNLSTSLHMTGATIESSGGSSTVSSGGNGGVISITTPQIVADQSSMCAASGGDGVTSGGNGNSISVWPPSKILAGSSSCFRGTLESTGGNGPQGTGGTGGSIGFSFEEQIVSGALYNDGGSGLTTGGNGGTITFHYIAESYIIPAYSNSGGAANATTGTANGGDGGTLTINQSAGETGTLYALPQSYDLSLEGGAGGYTGGIGGIVAISCLGNLTAGGNCYLSGGRGRTYGGYGGYLSIQSWGNCISTLNAEIYGGSCSATPAATGGLASILVYNNSPLTQSGNIIVSGGFGDGTDGGQGGMIYVEAQGTTSISGQLLAEGGNSNYTTGGYGGEITVRGAISGEIICNGLLSADGGGAEGTSLADGSNGGTVSLYCEDGSIQNNGTLRANGGDSYRTTGGNGGTVEVLGDIDLDSTGGNVVNAGTITVDGGIGLTGGTGGTAKVATNPDNTVATGIGNGSNSGAIYSRGGAGNNDGGLGGAPGTITCYGQGSFSNTGTISAVYGDQSPGPEGSVTID